MAAGSFLGQPKTIDWNPLSKLPDGVALELIQLDLQVRWRRGEGIPLEAYLDQFPEVGPAEALPPRLVYEEYRARRLYGDWPSLTAYRERFPGQFAELQRLAEQESPTLHARPVEIGGDARDLLGPEDKRYRLLDRIGGGSFGEVYRGEAPGGVPVAVKRIIKPIDQAEAQRELQSLELTKRLRHPFLLATHAYWLSGDRLYIVMELADRSLRDRLNEQAGATGVPLEELLTYMTQAAQALDYLHGQDVLHRDVKPGNILLLGGFVKLGDFGLARRLSAEDMLATGGGGTPHYMAPEVWLGSVSRRSDQYSLAVTYAELRLGRLPFSGRNPVEIMKAHLERIPDLASLPEAEQQVLFRALAKDPGRRYDGCQEFVQALRTPPTPEQVPSPSVPPARARRRLRQSVAVSLRILGAAGLLTLAILGVFWWATGQLDQRRAEDTHDHDGGAELRQGQPGAGEQVLRGPHGLPPDLEELIQKRPRADFDLDVSIANGRLDDTATYRLEDLQEVIFRVQAGERAHVVILTFAANTDLLRIYPNEHERDEPLPEKVPRRLPNRSVLRAHASEETEWVYVIASTEPLPEPKEAKRDGPYLILKTLDQRRTIGVERRPGKVAEKLLKYRVASRNGPGQK